MEVTMQRLAHILAIPTVVCFIAIMLWGEGIREFNSELYFLMFAVFAVGSLVMVVQSRIEKETAIANEAVAEYKKNNGIPD
jgi:hypothetical protein